MQNEKSVQDKPSILKLNPGNIPNELKNRAKWVCWKAEPDGEKWSKIPYSSSGSRSKVNDPSTWSDYEVALRPYEKGGYDGIGFVLTETDLFVGIDIDHCVVDGKIRPDVQGILMQLNSYAEISPSGTGVRIFIKGELPPGWRKKGKFEFYETGRYLTVTGHKIDFVPVTIEERQKELLEVYRQVENDADDREKLRKAYDSSKGPIIKQLFNGEWEGAYPSQSEADGALCFHLAKWFSDPEHLDRIFRRSALYRPKWDEKHYSKGDTYGQRIIKEALKKVKPMARKPEAIPVSNLLEMNLPPIQWIVEDLVTTGLTILSGIPKSGKTIVCSNIGLAVSTGGIALGHKQVTKSDVIFFALEDGLPRLQRRFKAMTRYMENIPNNLYIYTSCYGLGEGGRKFLNEILEKNQNIKLVIIDVYANISRVRGPSTNAYRADYKEIFSLKEIADNHDIAIILVHHQRKGPASDMVSTVLGTHGITGAADNILILYRKENTGQEVLHATGRDVETIEYAMKLDKEQLSWEILGSLKEIQSNETNQKIIDILKFEGTEMSPKEISDSTGIDIKKVKVYLGRMVRKGVLEKVARGKYSLPQEAESQQTLFE